MSSARFNLPFIVPGQSQKELTHNEAIQLLETISQPIVERAGMNVPPLSAEAGQQYIIGPEPTDAWSGMAGHLATWTGGGWRFIRPSEGLSAYDSSSGLTLRYTSGSWQSGVVQASEVRIGGEKVLGVRRAPIADPVGGDTVDADARVAISAILSTLRQHGLIAS